MIKEIDATNISSRDYEPVLKYLIQSCLSTDHVVDDPNCIRHVYENPNCVEILMHLRRLGMIDFEMELLSTDRILITKDGLLYFENKRKRRGEAVRTWRFNIIMALLSSLFGALLARLSMLLLP